MKPNTSVWLLFTVIVFLSCNSEIQYPIKYTPNSYMVGQIESISQNGKINSLSTINQFISSDFKDEFWSTDSDYTSFFLNEIELLSDSTAILTFQDTSHYINLFRLNGLIYFQWTDTLTIYRDMLENDKFKYSPLYTKAISSDFTLPKVEYAPCWYAFEKNGEIYFPFVTYFAENRGKYRLGSERVSSINNEFQDSFLDTLKHYNYEDTIVYQNNYLIFKPMK